MNKGWIVLMGVLLQGLLWAESPERLIYFIIEGASQRSMIGLKNKNKLPHLKTVYNQGNIRNMSVPLDRVSYENTMVPLMTGKWMDSDNTADSEDGDDHDDRNTEMLKEDFWLTPLLAKNEKMKAYCVISAPQNPEAKKGIRELLPSSLPKGVRIEYLNNTSASNVVQTALSMIPKRQKSYVLWLNFTQVDAQGHQYREGSEKYSNAIKKVDRALGQLFRVLKQRDQWKNTRIIGVSNYGFDAKSQLYQTHQKTWILANKKVMKKGTILDVVPSILAEWGVESSADSLFEKQELKQKEI